MHVTNRASKAMSWLVDFFNFDSDGSESERYGPIDATKSLQRKWTRILCFIVEPKPLAESVLESLQVGIDVTENLKTFNQKEVRDLTEKTLSEGKDPEKDSRIMVLTREIATYEKHIDRMSYLLNLGKDKISTQAGTIRKNDLHGAICLTPIEALEKLVEELNLWSLGKNANPVWKLKHIEETGSHTEPGQGVLRLAGTKFAVTSRLSRRDLEGLICSNVAKCLETGEFDRLRRCQLNECRCFFYAEHFRKYHCCTEHQKSKDNKENAANRVKKSRAKQAEVEKQKGVPQLIKISRELPRLLKTASPPLDRIRKSFGEDFENLVSLAEKIKRGENPDRVWISMPRRMKRKFAAIK